MSVIFTTISRIELAEAASALRVLVAQQRMNYISASYDLDMPIGIDTVGEFEAAPCSFPEELDFGRCTRVIHHRTRKCQSIAEPMRRC